MQKVLNKTLANGLKVLIQEDKNTPLVTVNTLFKVGSKNEKEEKTGFAHLFEHLMFEGSLNVSNFDHALQIAGGENNAFTNTDITNYYDSLPASNIETALWLESDRMLSLDFNEESLSVQKSIVSEEFKQNYLNKPYGDVWHLLMNMVYKVHPYKWPTIGKKLEHIEDITLQDTKDFFYTYYRPNNAILSIVGGIDAKKTLEKVHYWYEDIPKGQTIKTSYKLEPKQTEERILSIEKDVPQDVLYKAFPIGNRLSSSYYPSYLLCDILGNGSSSLLYKKLIDEKNLCTSLSCFLPETDDSNIFCIVAYPSEKTTLEEINSCIEDCIYNLSEKNISERDLEKAKNQNISYILFNNEHHSKKAFNLAYFEHLNRLDWYSNEVKEIEKIKLSEIFKTAKAYLKKSSCNTLFYKSKSNG